VRSAPAISLSRIALASIRLATRAWPLPFGQGLPAHLGAFATRIGVLGSEWYEFRPGLWMQLNVQDLVQQTIVLEGIWDPALTSLIESTLKPGDVFVDVGAHVGYFTLLAASRVGPAGRILSIEPNPVALDQLRHNVERSCLQNVLIAHTACGDSRDPVRLYLHTESNSSMASLSSQNATSGVAVDVSCTPLDDVCLERGLERVSLVKIDVEGAEFSVLRGMSRLLREMRPVVVLEMEPRLLGSFGTTRDSIVALLAEHDYRVAPLGGHSNYVCHPDCA
jgi:FkbM family methyltransferase